MYWLNSLIWRIASLMMLTLLLATPALAQDASPPSTGAPPRQTYGAELPSSSVRSAPASSYAQPAPSVPAPRDVSDTTSPATTSPAAGSGAEPKPFKPHKYFPYTIRSGDTLGTVAQFFGISVADLAHVNKLHEDDELEVGEELKVPNPFEASHRNLEAQVQQLSDQYRTTQLKIQQVQSQAAALTNSNAELSAQNTTLKDSVKALPWWRGTALAVGAASLLMLGVTGLTLFEWWMLRRRFLALSDLAMSLSRLDVKYKETIAKAELRMQQLYGRRRPAGAPDNLLGGMKTPDEVEVERLSHELRETLERHLEQLGVRGRRSIGARWREALGGDEEPSPEPRPYRR
jgi:LysM repeat protein